MSLPEDQANPQLIIERWAARAAAILTAINLLQESCTPSATCYQLERLAAATCSAWSLVAAIRFTLAKWPEVVLAKPSSSCAQAESKSMWKLHSRVFLAAGSRATLLSWHVTRRLWRHSCQAWRSCWAATCSAHVSTRELPKQQPLTWQFAVSVWRAGCVHVCDLTSSHPVQPNSQAGLRGCHSAIVALDSKVMHAHCTVAAVAFIQTSVSSVPWVC